MFVSKGKSGGSAAITKRGKRVEQNQYTYTRKIGRTTFSIVVKEAEGAKEKVDTGIKKLLLNDLSGAG